jgi:oxygen-independent coproporphyrinogen-3 oxidase
VTEKNEMTGLYVHIPFCPKVCPYCSFYKEASDRNKTQGFLDAVLNELDAKRNELSPDGRFAPVSIFFGGGTPSALSPAQLEYLLNGLRERLDLSRLTEWTLEMNPATVSLEKARLLRDLGVTRISMGVQSWDAEVLKTLGRVHSAEQAERSYALLREAGFENVNLDLMFAVPGQTARILEESLTRTINLAPEHISAYCLTYEEDTEFLRRYESGVYSRSDDAEAGMFEMVMERLESAGYAQYEISNYAKPGRECAHNLGYWEGNTYLGLGPSAWSTMDMRRWRNVPNTTEYVERIANSGDASDVREEMTAHRRQSEQLAFGIRTNRGIDAAAAAPFGLEIQPMISDGLIEEQADRLRLTRRGRMVADSIAEVFV